MVSQSAVWHTLWISGRKEQDNFHLNIKATKELNYFFKTQRLLPAI
jgi:hypothetical protein